MPVALGRDETTEFGRGCGSGDDSAMTKSSVRLPSRPSSSPICKNGFSSSLAAIILDVCQNVQRLSYPSSGVGERSSPRPTIVAVDGDRFERVAPRTTIRRAVRDGRGQGRTGDGRDCMAVAPARRAGQNDGWGAAATVVLAIAKGVCLRGGATRIDGERGTAARAAADAKLCSSEATSGGCHGQGEG